MGIGRTGDCTYCCIYPPPTTLALGDSPPAYTHRQPHARCLRRHSGAGIPRFPTSSVWTFAVVCLLLFAKMAWQTRFWIRDTYIFYPPGRESLRTIRADIGWDILWYYSVLAF